ncbi:hypothetical protein ACFSSF_10175 [Dietzia aerolata]|uniref:hypothetical protein n=1 Tax=Dietzia aerolata TaxID=595984 RepID=UPI003638494E
MAIDWARMGRKAMHMGRKYGPTVVQAVRKQLDDGGNSPPCRRTTTATGVRRPPTPPRRRVAHAPWSTRLTWMVTPIRARSCGPG